MYSVKDVLGLVVSAGLNSTRDPDAMSIGYTATYHIVVKFMGLLSWGVLHGKKGSISGFIDNGADKFVYKKIATKTQVVPTISIYNYSVEGTGVIITNPALKPADAGLGDVEITIEIDELEVIFSAYVIDSEETKRCEPARKARLKEQEANRKRLKREAEKRAHEEELLRARQETGSDRRRRIRENNRRTNESNVGGGVIRNPSTGIITRRS